MKWLWFALAGAVLAPADAKLVYDSGSRVTVAPRFLYRGDEVATLGLLREGRSTLWLHNMGLRMASSSFYRTNSDWCSTASSTDLMIAVRTRQRLTLTAGWSDYSALHWAGGEFIPEVHADAELDVLGHPYLSARYAYINPVGVYLELGGRQRLPLGGDFSVDLHALTAFDPGRGVGGFHHGQLRATVEWRAWHKLRVGGGAWLTVPSSSL